MGAFTPGALEAVLEVARAPLSFPGTYLRDLAEVLRDAADAQSVGIFELDLAARAIRFYEGTDADDDPDDEGDPERDELAWSQFWSGPCSYTERGTPFARRGDTGMVASPADLYQSRREYLRATPFELGRDAGLDTYVIVPLAREPGRSRRVLINRDDPGGRFDDWDLLALRLLQPHLDAAVARALVPRGSRGPLTARQLEILSYVRAGHSNDAIAALLQVEPSTVRKHLENAYARLGVHSRTAAVAAAFPPTATGPPAPRAD